MISPITLSVIIVNYNSAKFCTRCLASIQKFAPHAKYEIIVVDNASKKNDLEYLKAKWQQKLPIRFLQLSKNIGYGQGNEAGIAIATGKFLAILNPDIELKEPIFDQLLEILQQKPNTGIIAPKLVYDDGSIQDSFRHFPHILDLILKRTPLLRTLCTKRIRQFLMWDIDFSKIQQVDWVVGAFFLTPQKIWKQVGGFDPRYFLFLEDTDVCRSMWKHHYKVLYCPLVEAQHHHTRLSGGHYFFSPFFKKTLYIHIQSAVKYFWKWRKK